MAAKNIESFNTSIGDKINFTFTDGTKASGIYNPKTGVKISGDASAPSVFSLTKQANVKQQTTQNLSNLQKLESKNYITNGQVSSNYKQNISSAVKQNEPDMSACIKQRLKDILGIFTLPFGLPLELPKLPTTQNKSIGEIFSSVGNDLKNAAKGIKDSIVGSIKGIADSIKSTIDIGDLSVSKFLGCDQLAVSSPTEKKEIAKSQVKQQQVTTKALQTSTTTLQTKAENKVTAQVEPVKTSQNNISSLTPVT